MPYRQLFFINDKLLGEASRGKVLVHSNYQAPQSYLFFCPCCGEVFARCPVIADDGVVSQWQSLRRFCYRCRDKSIFLDDWPGCITVSWDNDFTDAFPLPVLQYELERHIQHFERIHNGN